MGAVKGKKGKTMLNIIPQKFSFTKPTLKMVKVKLFHMESKLI